MSLFAFARVKIQRLNVDDIGVKWGAGCMRSMVWRRNTEF
ncbi:hypothetical protein VCR26J2_670046 [Vibrio coralliirubri]|nr:hypothetical protein VCR6J2_250088 [Vibrio coralliirubri]CDT91610.1 hypothetical protein VCR26J2_670046 [Vibrio coralliirubri]